MNPLVAEALVTGALIILGALIEDEYWKELRKMRIPLRR